jgi:putative DNA primase/helicase
LGAEDVRRGKWIERKLRDAGADDLYFMLPGQVQRWSFGELDNVAREMGVELLPEDATLGVEKPQKALSLGEFLDATYSPREWVLEPIMPRGGLVMLYAWRGVGKTSFVLGMALAVASGTAFLRWRAPKALTVLYVDGELQAEELQQRLTVYGGAEWEAAKTNLRIENCEQRSGVMPYIDTPEGQQAIEYQLEGISLLVLDSLSTLCRNGDGIKAWESVQPWLLDLKRRGKSVLIIHHAGKRGDQRGPSKREDILDTVIKLTHPDDYTPSQGARFEVHFTKNRGFFGESAEPFGASLTTPDGKAVWSISEIDDRNQRARELFNAGKSVTQVAKKLNIGRSTAGRIRQRLKEDGLLDMENDGEND